MKSLSVFADVILTTEEREKDAILPPFKDTNISLLPYTVHSSPANNYLAYNG